MSRRGVASAGCKAEVKELPVRHEAHRWNEWKTSIDLYRQVVSPWAVAPGGCNLEVK